MKTNVELYVSLLDVAIIILLALIPAVSLMVKIYRRDKTDQEPVGLLLLCVLGGVLAAVLASNLEALGSIPLGWAHVTAESLGKNSDVWYVALYALMIGFSEEFSKLVFLYLFTWKNKNFNFLFDGIVYAVFVSLGFAGLENILYVMHYPSLAVVILRAVLSVPGHMCFSVFQGYFYSRAKRKENCGDMRKMRLEIFQGLLLAAVTHACYDGIILSGKDYNTIVFAIFFVIVDLYAWRIIKTESVNDGAIL